MTRVAVDGVDGAGKTMFADEIAAVLVASGREAIRVSADDFLNPREIRHRKGRNSPEGFFLDSYDYDALRRLVLRPLAADGSRRLRRRAFDVKTDAPVTAPEETAAPGAVLLLDGLFMHRDELRGVWDYSVFLDVDFEISVARCAARGTPWASREVNAPSNYRYVGGQRIYLTRCTPQQRATRVIDNNVLTAPIVIR